MNTNNHHQMKAMATLQRLSSFRCFDGDIFYTAEELPGRMVPSRFPTTISDAEFFDTQEEPQSSPSASALLSTCGELDTEPIESLIAAIEESNSFGLASHAWIHNQLRERENSVPIPENVTESMKDIASTIGMEKFQILLQISHMVGRISVGSESTILSGIAVGAKSFVTNQSWHAPWSVTNSQKINLKFHDGPNSPFTYTLRFRRRIPDEDLAVFVLDESSPRFACSIPLSCLDGEVSIQELESLVDVGYVKRKSEPSGPDDGVIAEPGKELTFSYRTSELEAHFASGIPTFDRPLLAQRMRSGSISSVFYRPLTFGNSFVHNSAGNYEVPGAPMIRFDENNKYGFTITALYSDRSSYIDKFGIKRHIKIGRLLTEEFLQIVKEEDEWNGKDWLLVNGEDVEIGSRVPATASL